METKRIAPDVKIGKEVKIYDFTNLYGCEIGDNTKIGTFVEIQKNAKIGPETRIQSHSFICSKVRIGKRVFIGHGVVFINDDVPIGSYQKVLISKALTYDLIGDVINNN